MRYPAFVRAAALALPAALIFCGAAQAQAQLQAQTRPEPLTMTDAAPLPAQDRTSVGAVIFLDDPVLAQREAMQQVLARTPVVDTTTMGAGPAALAKRPALRDELLRMDRKKTIQGPAQ